MTRVEGSVSRFFFNPVTKIAVLRLKGAESARELRVLPLIAAMEDFLLTGPGDEVAFEIDQDDVLESWYNGSYW